MNRALPPDVALPHIAHEVGEVAPAMPGRGKWRDGNQIVLLENGEGFFPRVFEAIAGARHEVLIETFILFADKVGHGLAQVLIAAARRGVRVELTVDGYGSAFLPVPFLSDLVRAGVRVHVYDPRPTILGVRVNLIHRLHRKIVVIDRERAFVGGINFSADHLSDFGPEAKQDYSVEIEGPVVADIHRFAVQALRGRAGKRDSLPGPPASRPPHPKGPARVLFVIRDNHHHTTDIENHYLAAIRAARRRILIVNAYFFPGFRLLRHLRQAASRGVEVELVVQGQPDMPIVRFGARLLYNYLIHGGVKIYEYVRRPVHAKVALVDDDWATVGSSNLDPLSLAVNLEANVIIRDTTFNRALRERFDCSMREDCRAITLERVIRGYWWRAPIVALIFHVLRRLHTIARWLPAPRPTLVLVEPPDENPSVPSEPPPASPPEPPPRPSPPSPVEPAAEGRRQGWRRLWPWVKRLGAAALFALVASLLVLLARRIQWAEVLTAVRAQSPWTLLLAGAVGTMSYLVYGCFDLLGKRYTRHPLPVRRVLPVSLACYAFTLNIGISLGAIALRYRLYGRMGLPALTTAKVLTLSVFTTWLGYLAMGGLVFTLVPLTLPDGWKVSSDWLRPIGLAMLVLAVGYVVACATARRRSISWRHYTLTLPRARLGAAQVALGTLNWALMALMIDILLPDRVAYTTVLAVLLVGAVAGVLAHIPAGLGVLEAVYVTLLGHRVGEVQVLAALIGYRALYYLMPLLLATVVVAWIETTARRRDRRLRDQAQ